MLQFLDKHERQKFYVRALGPFLRPKVATTLTKRRLYCMRRLARPVFFFFFSWASTLGVWPLTLPARARDPWTFPPRTRTSMTRVARFSMAARLAPLSRGLPEEYTTRS